LSAPAQALATRLCDYWALRDAQSDHYCHPSGATLAAETGFSRVTMWKAAAELVAAGYIYVRSGHGGKDGAPDTANRYYPRLAPEDRRAPASASRERPRAKAPERNPEESRAASPATTALDLNALVRRHDEMEARAVIRSWIEKGFSMPAGFDHGMPDSRAHRFVLLVLDGGKLTADALSEAWELSDFN
jgi:hypothetical protein